MQYTNSLYFLTQDLLSGLPTLLQVLSFIKLVNKNLQNLGSGTNRMSMSNHNPMSLNNSILCQQWQ